MTAPSPAGPLPHLSLPEHLPGGPDMIRVLVKAVEQSPVSVIITDRRGLIQYVNPKFTQLMGFTAEEAVGKTPRIIKGDFLSRDFYADMWATIQAGREWHGVFNNRTKSGALVWEVASISPIRDEHGEITHFVGIKEDITEMKRLQEQLEHLARHDQLTDLANRVLFADRLQQALAQARRAGTQFATLFLDLDGFKQVNDSHGHDAGDALLVALARRLETCVRASDTLARMGGDEFTLLFPDVKGRDNAERLARKLRAAITEPVTLAGGATVQVDASIGISLFPEHGDTADRLMSQADTAMYQAKRAGKGTIRFA